MKTVWETYDETQLEEAKAFGKQYRSFLDRTKTEREFVREAAALAEAEGFTNIHDSVGELNPGDRLYAVNRGKNICLFVIGEQPLTKGMNVLGAHIDSPRLDLKQKPIYEKDGFVLFDTHYYGGIKKYQWTARPMALHGVVIKKDGTAVSICIGEDPEEPVVGVSEILIHLAAKQMEKKASEAVEGEALDLIVGSIPRRSEDGSECKDPVKAYLLDLLKEQYDIEEDDFLSAEIEVVPAEHARLFGLDCSMIMAYGHDDRICAYTSLQAILDMKTPKRTSCCILVDKEEVGSIGATGMSSRWFENVIVNLLDRSNAATLPGLNRTLTASRMLSSDVSAGFDPIYDSVFERKNAAFLGCGITFNKYTGARGKSGSNDANPEYIAEIRRIMDDESIVFQTAELGKVDAGGGGTIAYILAGLNMEVIDAGIPVLNMHSPSEIASVADIYEAYRAYKAFLRHAGS